MRLLPPLQTDAVAAQAARWHALDESQARVVEAVCAGNQVTSVLGAPGTGKTTLVTQLVRGLTQQNVSADKIMVLSASRRSAGELRNLITSSIAGPVQGAVVRTAAALAFSILTAVAASRREPIPRLITGPEQDQLLAQLLEGYSDGTLDSPRWPVNIPAETLDLRGFRGELRDLMMRAAENGLESEELEALGQRYERPEWIAAADVMRDYEQVTTLATLAQDAGRRYDPAQIVDDAAVALANWPGPDRPHWDVVIVDDYHEATAATARLLTVLRMHGTRLVLIGDPDVAVQGFRGGRASLIAQAAAGSQRDVSFAQEKLGHFGAEQHALEFVHRNLNAPVLRECVQRVSRAIASVGAVTHRNASAHTDASVHAAASDAAADPVQVVVLESAALEASYIARTLRTEHLRHGRPWTDMAVVARSGSQLLHFRRALAQAGVPVAVVGTDIPLRDEPAVRPLLTAIKSCLVEIDIEMALDLIGSTIGGADAIAVRKIRRALRTQELRSGGGRTSDELIIEALSDPEWTSSLGAVGQPLAKVARVVQAGRTALETSGATPQTVLWAIWNATGLAELWQRTALSGSAAAPRADRDLDAVMSLFRSAETYVDRLPESSAADFVVFIESQDIPADSLSQQTALGGKVSLVTPPGAAGQEWPVVVVAGVQEGSWPDLRLRDSLLGAATLVEVLSGRSLDARGLGPQARKEIFHDELRAFVLAISRAADKLFVTAVHDEENEPSVFLNLVKPPSELGENDSVHHVQQATPADIPLDLRGVTALARAELVGALEHQDEVLVRSRAKLLRYLAEQGVSEASPESWFGAETLSTSQPLFDGQDEVPLSPSRVESVQRCALRWALETSGGSPSAGLSQNVGTLIHAIAADYPDGRLHEMLEALERRWPQLRLPDGWPARRQFETARKMLEKLAEYYTKVRAEGLREVHVERGFSLECEGASIHGIVDRLEVDQDGNVRIVDLKTGKTAPTAADTAHNPQLGIYQLAVLDGAFGEEKTSGGAALVYVATGTKSVTTRKQEPISDPEENWAKEMVHDAVAVMRSNTFIAQTNPMCPMCPVRRSCPLQNEGQHVIPLGQTQTRATHTDTVQAQTQTQTQTQGQEETK